MMREVSQQFDAEILNELFLSRDKANFKACMHSERSLSQKK